MRFRKDAGAVIEQQCDMARFEANPHERTDDEGFGIYAVVDAGLNANDRSGDAEADVVLVIVIDPLDGLFVSRPQKNLRGKVRTQAPMEVPRPGRSIDG